MELLRIIIKTLRAQIAHKRLTLEHFDLAYLVKQRSKNNFYRKIKPTVYGLITAIKKKNCINLEFLNDLLET